jgi:hypothetical protein
MELLNIQRARSAWLLHLNDLNPRGKSISESLIEWLGSAYHFSRKPSSPTDLDESKALAFTGGEFQLRDEFFIEVELRIYNDGIVGDTRSSTEDTDKFLQDVLDTFSKEFALPHRPETIRKKLYHSELIVKTDKSLAFLNPRLSQFTAKLAALTGVRNSATEPSGIKFWALDTGNPQMTEFVFERQLGTVFEERRYWSKAAIPTTQHLEMLNLLESILTAPQEDSADHPEVRFLSKEAQNLG